MDFSGKSIKAVYKACHFQGKQTSLNALNVAYLSKCFLSFNHGLLALCLFSHKTAAYNKDQISNSTGFSVVNMK